MEISIKKIKKNKEFYELMQAEWRPYVMFNHNSNFRSKIVNTDIYGLRFNNLNKKYKNKSESIFKENNKKNCAVVLGNSTAFGEGSSDDKNTISSILSRNSNIHFYNFCGRGFTGYQELINLQLLIHKLKNLKKIIIISGLNDSIMPFYIKEYSAHNSPIYGYNLFKNAMASQVISWKKKFLEFFLKIFISKKINFKVLNRTNIFDQSKIINQINFLKTKRIGNNLDSYKEIIDRNFQLMSILQKSTKAKVYFFLQPVGSWCSKQKTKEEKILFDDERKDKKLQKIYQHVDKKKYSIVKGTTQKAAKKHKIKFFDLNEALSIKKFNKDWFFISRFHINDNCNKVISSIIKKVL